MSGHLANLLDRATERTPLLQRRRRALFEPAEGTMDLSTSVAGPAAAADTAATAAQLLPAKPAPAAIPAQQRYVPEQRGAVDGAARRPEAPPAAFVPAADSAAPRRAAQESAADAIARVAAADAASPPPTPAPAVVGAARLAAAEPPLLRRAALGIGEAPGQTPLPARHAHREPREPELPRTAATPGQAASPPAAIVETRPAIAASALHAARPLREPASAALRPAVPVVAALRTAAATLPAVPAAPAPAPAVSIHIGRIELRATAPAAAERAARPAAPKLGLADYLRARHGGRP